MTRLWRVLAAGTVALASVSCVLLVALMGVTATDVVGRYWFDAPLRGAFELTELLLAALVFAAFPLVTSREEHITADLVTTMAGPRVTRGLAQLGRLVTATVLFVLAVLLVEHGLRLQADSLTTTALDLPLAPLAFGGALACGLCALITLRQLVARDAS